MDLEKQKHFDSIEKALRDSAGTYYYRDGREESRNPEFDNLIKQITEGVKRAFGGEASKGEILSLRGKFLQLHRLLADREVNCYLLIPANQFHTRSTHTDYRKYTVYKEDALKALEEFEQTLGKPASKNVIKTLAATGALAVAFGTGYWTGKANRQQDVPFAERAKQEQVEPVQGR